MERMIIQLGLSSSNYTRDTKRRMWITAIESIANNMQRIKTKYLQYKETT